MVFGNLFGQPRIKDGERGHAVVMARDRPSESATHHYIRLSLQVHVPSRAPYLLEQRFNVRTAKMPEPGDQLPVTVDRGDPERLRIEWDDVPTWRDKVRAQHEASLQGGPLGGLQPGSNVQVTHHTIDATSDPAALAEVQELLRAQGIDLGQMLGGVPAPQAAPPAADDGVDDVVASLERLVRLRDAGALTPAEFEAQKARILGGG